MEAEAEAMENAFVVGKILWLLQTILDSTSNGKLVEWIRHAGLGEGVGKLTSEIERIETVVAAAKGRANGNKPLARSLARLKELLYDADDLVDDLDYFRLQEQVEGDSTIACVNDPEGTDGDGDGAEQVEGSRDNPDKQRKKRRNRCPEWDHFTEIKDDNGKVVVGARCKYCEAEVSCGGTTGSRGLKTHINSKKCQRNRQPHVQPPNPASDMDAEANDITDATQDSFRGKRMRIDKASTHSNASNTCPGDKDKISNNIDQIVSGLKGLREEVCDFLKDSVPCSDQCLSNTDTRIRTSSFAPRKVYGRDVEKEYIIRVITATESDRITVLPIVGIVGVGKTAVAQLVYNDPAVKSEFERIWVWVSDSFDEVRLTREMLDVVCHEGTPHYKESYDRIGNYSKLQEILKEHIGQQPRRFLLVLDDVSDRMDNTRWKQLLAPLESSDKKGNVIVITTRSLSVARRLGTVEPIKLGALENDDFLLLFKACAFGDDNYEGHPSLTIIGHQIAAKLKGNPLAAETAGELLNEHLTMDHWSSILKSEHWKSMQLNKSIMHALKLSYDKLPYNLQQCFLYCSIFPNNYKFIAEDLVFSWIAQGFMRPINSGKTPEDIGRDYLNWLVDLCFFEHVKRKDPTLGNQVCYVMCGIVHDFARLISRTECAVIDGIECNEMLPTTRHLSILTDSVYGKRDQQGNLFRNLKFEEKLRGVITSATKLRTLVLIGEYDYFFFQSFADVFHKAPYLWMLQMSATYADFKSFMCKLVNATHLRYLKLENKSSIEESHISVSNFYHLQVLDVEHPISRGINCLVSMRRLAVQKGAQVTDQHSICFETLQSMNELAQLDVYQLENVSRAEADGAKLRDKQHLEKLHLSWNEYKKLHLSWNEYASDTWSESEDPSDDTDPGSESRSTHMEPEEESASDTCSESEDPVDATDPGSESTSSEMDPEEERSPVNGSYSSPVTENIADSESRDGRPQVTDTDPDLEQPSSVHMETVEAGSSMHNSKNNPNYEQFTGTAIDVLDGLKPHHKLKHLRVSGYSGAAFPDWFSSSEVSVTCLQTLHLDDCGECQILPSLESLRFLTKLKLRNMRKITEVSIPPLEELVLIKMPKLERCFCNSTRDLNSSLRVLLIERCRVLEAFPLFESCDKLGIEHKSWLSGLSELTIHDCPLLRVSNPLPPSSSTCKLSISRVSTLAPMEGSSNGELIIGSDGDYEDSNKLRKLDDKILAFHNLRVLTHLIILRCKNLSYVSLKCFRQLISLKRLEIQECGELFSSDVLEHAHEDMETANFSAFPTLKHLSIHSYLSNKIMGKWVSVMLRHAPVLEELFLYGCKEITGLLLEGKESCLSNHNSSPRASSPGNPDDASTSTTRGGLVHIPSNLVSSLKILSIMYSSALTFLEKEASFSAFTSLEELEIHACPKLISYFEPKVENSDYANGGYLQLKWLWIDDCSILTTSFCKHLTSLQYLYFVMWPREVTGLTNEQDGALQMITSLQVLGFSHCSELVDLPVGLHSLSSLKILRVTGCPRILSLPEKGLPPLLEKLEIVRCNQKLASECRLLATSMLKVRISNY